MFVDKFIEFIVKRREAFVNRAISSETVPVGLRYISDEAGFFGEF